MLQKSGVHYTVTSSTFSTKLEGSEAKTVISNPMPIVWSCQGLSCLIEEQSVKNMAQHQLDQKKFCEMNDLPWHPELFLDWNSNLTLQQKKHKGTRKRNASDKQTEK